MECPEKTLLETESRLVVAWALGRSGDWLHTHLYKFPGWWKCSVTALCWWLQNSINFLKILNCILTLGRFLCLINHSSIEPLKNKHNLTLKISGSITQIQSPQLETKVFLNLATYLLLTYLKITGEGYYQCSVMKTQALNDLKLLNETVWSLWLFNK